MSHLLPDTTGTLPPPLEHRRSGLSVQI